MTGHDPRARRLVWPTLLALALLGPPAWGGRAEGDLTVIVRDPAGAAVAARVRLVNRASAVSAGATADANGKVRFTRLPLGPYALEVSAPGFETQRSRIEIPTPLPLRLLVTLPIAPLVTEIGVERIAPLLDPAETGVVLRIGRRALAETPATAPGRGIVNHIADLPGWLLEANAVLHPRGSEYDTQYVIDGVPIYDNRSISFAPGFAGDEFESVEVLTGSIPAEYGRRLGGVVELFPRRSDRLGHRPELMVGGGSFATLQGAFSDYWRNGRTALSAGARGSGTDRRLDPPSLGNFNNSATSAGLYTLLDRDLSERDRLSVYFRSNRVAFLAPNDRAQHEAGQRQDRRSSETTGQVHYQRSLSADRLLSLRAMVRDLSAELRSNALSTPVRVSQDRGIREAVFSAAFTRQGETHTVKFGGDYRTAAIRESFRVLETAGRPVVTGVSFNERKRSHEASAFLTDHVRLGHLTIDAGLRFDSRRLFESDTAWSPRLGFSYFVPGAKLLVRGSYDRVFQTPPLENLLLSSSARALRLDGVEQVLAVPTSRANFFEVGARKVFADLWRLDASYYWRDFENFYDDDVFLNTGISFPISFESARVEGLEVRLELPRWRSFSSFLSYANMIGRARSPVTGGLFIAGGEADELRGAAAVFPLTQDQRNTFRSSLRWAPHRRLRIATKFSYGSGLPVELPVETDVAVGNLEGIPAEILERIDFERGRVKPNFSLDFSVGVKLWRRDDKEVELQFDVLNAADRLNVINFSGLFSGAALAPPRTFGVKLRVSL